MASLNPPKPELDPARHWLVYSEYEQTSDGIGRFRPIPLDEAAASGRSALETASADTGKPLNRSGIVVLPPGRATTIAGLLEELSLRLKPGTEAGPIQSDGSLSALARELADYVNRLANP